jgi:hypothetical protein
MSFTVQFESSAKTFEQSGGLAALATCLRNNPNNPELYTAFCCVMGCIAPIGTFFTLIILIIVLAM